MRFYDNGFFSKNKNLHLLLCVLFSILSFGAPDAIAEQPLWKDLGDWQVRVDETLGGGCFVFVQYEQGTVLRVGWNPSKDNAYLLIGNAKWSSLEENKLYSVKIKFDDLKPWETDARGFPMGPIVFLWITIEDPNFLKEFSTEHTFKLFYSGEEISRLSLDGSHNAIREMLECQKYVNDSPSYKDPFEDDSDDPFAG